MQFPVCLGAEGCFNSSLENWAVSRAALERWRWNYAPRPNVSGCQACNMSSQYRRACSRSKQGQEHFVSELVGALGVSRGTFLEMGAHDGEFESNSIFLEAC